MKYSLPAPIAVIIGATIVSGSVISATRAATNMSPTRASSDTTTITCNDPKRCISVRNNGHGSGIVGISTFDDNRKSPDFAVEQAGIYGIDLSKNPLNLNAGVIGRSLTGEGAAGVTAFNSGLNSGAAGILALDLSTTMNSNVALFAVSNKNSGALGITNANRSVGDNGAAGVIGEDLSTTESINTGVVGISLVNNAVFAGSLGKHNSTLFLFSGGGGPLIDATNASKQVMSLDYNGNMVLAGKLTQNGTPTAALATSTGSTVVTYSAQQSVATLEDVGEGKLAAGRADVRLDPTFASAVDGRTPYLVFLTPQGKTQGLYVEQKGPAGFVVREYGAASSVAFDYRVVATPFGSHAERLPRMHSMLNARAAFDQNALRNRLKALPDRIRRVTQ